MPGPPGAALVTGAGKRIGRALALELAEAGYDVAVHYHSSKAEAADVVCEISAKGRKAIAIQADLSNEIETVALIDNANEALGFLSLLVNSASAFEDDDITSMTRDSWAQHIDTNLYAPLKLSQGFAAQIKPDVDSLIINMIDQRVLKLTPQFLSYTASKTALFTLTKTLAQALGPKGVRVNAIGPGPTLKNSRQSDADWARQNKATVLGYGASLEDICGALMYLTTARAVTGQMIVVDGGQHLAWQTLDVLGRE